MASTHSNDQLTNAGFWVRLGISLASCMDFCRWRRRTRNGAPSVDGEGRFSDLRGFSLVNVGLNLRCGRARALARQNLLNNSMSSVSEFYLWGYGDKPGRPLNVCMPKVVILRQTLPAALAPFL